MKKKDYQKPTMNIVKLQHHLHILAGSVEASGSGSLQDYNWNDPVEESRFFDMEDIQLIY